MPRIWTFQIGGGRADNIREGQPWRAWTEPWYDRTGRIRLKADGNGCGEPSWEIDDRVLIIDLDTGKPVALLTVVDEPWWDEVCGSRNCTPIIADRST